MTTPRDPLEAPAITGPTRLNYLQGTLLDSADFEHEQRYHRGRLARGLEYLFGPGTVAGLDLRWRASDEEIQVTPGLAIDPLGRLIEVPRSQCIRIRRWFRSQRAEDLQRSWIDEFGQAVVIADLFIRARVVEQGRTPRFAEGAFDALDATGPARLQDGFELGLVLREEAGARRLGLSDPSSDPEDVVTIPVPDGDEIRLALPPGELPPLQELILGLWRDDESAWENGRPPRLTEHLQPRVQVIDGDQTLIGRDPTALMLGRLAIPVDAVEGSVPVDRGEMPLFDQASPIDEYRRGKFVRRFVYAHGHLTQPAARGDTP